MSRENVEVVRRAVEAGRPGSRPDFDTINALFHPEHVFVPAISGVEGRSYRGAKGYRDYLREMEEAWGPREATVERLEAIDAERVLVVGVLRGRSKRAEVPQEWRFAYVMTVRDGKVVGTEEYGSVENALEAVGLRE